MSRFRDQVVVDKVYNALVKRLRDFDCVVVGIEGFDCGYEIGACIRIADSWRIATRIKDNPKETEEEIGTLLADSLVLKATDERERMKTTVDAILKAAKQ